MFGHSLVGSLVGRRRGGGRRSSCWVREGGREGGREWRWKSDAFFFK